MGKGGRYFFSLSLIFSHPATLAPSEAYPAVFSPFEKGGLRGISTNNGGWD